MSTHSRSFLGPLLSAVILGGAAPARAAIGEIPALHDAVRQVLPGLVVVNAEGGVDAVGAVSRNLMQLDAAKRETGWAYDSVLAKIPAGAGVDAAGVRSAIAQRYNENTGRSLQILSDHENGVKSPERIEQNARDASDLLRPSESPFLVGTRDDLAAIAPALKRQAYSWKKSVSLAMEMTQEFENVGNEEPGEETAEDYIEQLTKPIKDDPDFAGEARPFYSKTTNEHLFVVPVRRWTPEIAEKIPKSIGGYAVRVLVEATDAEEHAQSLLLWLQQSTPRVRSNVVSVSHKGPKKGSFGGELMIVHVRNDSPRAIQGYEEMLLEYPSPVQFAYSIEKVDPLKPAEKKAKAGIDGAGADAIARLPVGSKVG